MSAKWFGGAARLAIVASAVACNAILGIQDLPAGTTGVHLSPFDGGAGFGACQGNVYMVKTGDACGCSGLYYAVCHDNTYSECACSAPPGFTDTIGPTDDGGGDDSPVAFEGGFSDASDFDTIGFEDFDATEFDGIGFEDGGFGDGAFGDDSGLTEFDAFPEDAGGPPPPPPPLDAGR